MSIFSGKRGRQASIAASQQIQNGADTAYGYLDKAYDQSKEQFGKAATTLGDLAGGYDKASTLYQDALGVNGAAAADSARGSYTPSAGYQFNLDQGLQGLARARAVNGTLASGGADADAMKYASGLASQDFGQWLDRLGGLDTKRYGATTAQAGTFGDLGRVAYGVGASKAGIAQQSARDIAAQTVEGYKAGDRADANRFGAIMGGLNLVSSLAGKAMGAMGGGGAFSIFGGGGDGGLGIGKDSDWV